MDLAIALKQLSSSENLQWAWEKVRRYYYSDPVWRDELEIASFEINLDSNLREIAEELQSGSYRPRPVRPLGQPKVTRSNKENKQIETIELRQTFWVPVKDQVAWIALVNIIGPSLDNRMPKWSFGNRLYRPAWYEDIPGGKRVLRIGPYRRSSPFLYRKFPQSWPLYRRYVYLTLRSMLSARARDYLELERSEREILELEKKLPAGEKFPYLTGEYWVQRSRHAFWASLDFKQFYPKLKMSVVRSALTTHSRHAADPIFLRLFEQMTRFPLDTSMCSNEHLLQLSLSDRPNECIYLPTGLMVAGFLANVAMLSVDDAVQKVAKRHQIAHFRYVDDHIVLARSIGGLVTWIRKYKDILHSEGDIAEFNIDKVEPGELKSIVESSESRAVISKGDMQLASEACSVDIKYPKPFLTKTLSRISQLAQIEFDLQAPDEQLATINDLELLLLAEIDDSEIAEATRLSFAATVLSRVVPRYDPLKEGPSEILREMAVLEEAQQEALDHAAPESRRRAKRLVEIKKRLAELEQLLADHEKGQKRERRQQYERCFALLLKVLHKHPDKLRIWERAIEFCIRTGFSGVRNGIRRLLEEATHIGTINPTAKQYLDAFLGMSIATRLLEELRRVNGDAMWSARSNEWEEFLRVCDRFSATERNRLQSSPIGQFDRGLFGVSCAAAKFEDYMTLRPGQGDEKSRGVLSATIWKVLREECTGLALARKCSPSVIMWWLDGRISPIIASQPSRTWQALSEKLVIRVDEDWKVLQKYPQTTPRHAYQALVSGEKRLDNDSEGWGLEVLLAGAKHGWRIPRNEFGANKKVVSIAKELARHAPSHLTLIQWVQWARRQSTSELSSWDPRLGEWTSLEILRQLLAQVQAASARRSNVQPEATLHPANVLVPRNWSEIPVSSEKPLSWQEWGKRCRNEGENHGGLVLQRPELRIQDGRYFPRGDIGPLFTNIPALAARAAGLVLLGLLRRTFDLPGYLNRAKFPVMWDSIMRRLIGNISCSSWTTAILEGCLTTRPRESILLEIFRGEYDWTDDTTNDPPRIQSLFDLHNAVVHAQKVLERYQLTIRSHQPRQVTPVLVEQIPRFPGLNDEPDGD